MSGMYPRTVSITRPLAQDSNAGGNVGYLGQNRLSETTIFTGLPASIQAPSIGSRRVGGDSLPADAPGPIRWNVFVPKANLAKGSVQDRDIVIDDEGLRYQVAAAYWNLLGYKLQTIRLEA